MVTHSDRFKALWALDLCGTAAAIGILAFGFWFGLLKSDAAGKQIGDVRAFGMTQVTDLQAIRQQIHQQELIRDSQLKAVTERGALPKVSFIDRDLATITSIARNHQLDIADVTPQEPINYSAVVEQRYNINLVGTFPDYVRFLQQFEDSDCWADITTLSLRSDPSITRNPEQQSGQLSISFYSVSQDAADPSPGVEVMGNPSGQSP